MAWLQIKFLVPKEQVETCSDLLSMTGALAVTWQDQNNQTLFEPTLGATPLWEKIQIIGLYPLDTNIVLLKKELQQYLPNNIILQTEILADQDWQNSWQQHFVPLQFGAKLWICPSWCSIPDPNAHNVILDPGLAFGTGTHPTTALCLEWLAANLCPNNTVIDYGCGSGILGLAAAKLGAKTIHCVDCDPQALTSTRENAMKNNISPTRLLTYQPHELPTTIQANVVIANILANPLIELAPLLAHHVQIGGSIILSGILSTQGGSVLAVYRQWFENLDIINKDEWVRIAGLKICK